MQFSGVGIVHFKIQNPILSHFPRLDTPQVCCKSESPPSRLPSVRERLPILSTSHSPTKVKVKLTAAVTADSQMAASELFTPDILMMVAL